MKLKTANPDVSQLVADTGAAIAQYVQDGNVTAATAQLWGYLDSDPEIVAQILLAWFRALTEAIAAVTGQTPVEVVNRVLGVGLPEEID